MRRFYLDANATYGPLPSEWLSTQVTEMYGYNPSSVHYFGQQSRIALEEARRSIIRLLDGASGSKLIFTAGATEANNTALFSLFEPHAPVQGHIMSSTLEHSAVLEPLKRLEGAGASVRLLGPRELTPEGVCQAVREDTRLVSLMLANNETGQIFPIREIVESLRSVKTDLIIHCDGAQAVGKIPVSLQELDVDLFTFSGHKFGAFPGIGALVASERSSVKPIIVGGAQEQRLRAGTENTIGIHSLLVAAELFLPRISERAEKMERIRNRFEQELREKVERITFIGEKGPRLPNTSCVRFSGVRADDGIVALDLNGIAASSGSACSSGKQQVSHVLLGMGFSEEEAGETIRFSFREDFDLADMPLLIERLSESITGLRANESSGGVQHVR